MGPFSAGPIVTTTLLAFPIALAIDSVSWKVDWTALMRLDSSFDMICGGDVIVARKINRMQYSLVFPFFDQRNFHIGYATSHIGPCQILKDCIVIAYLSNGLAHIFVSCIKYLRKS